MAIPPFGHTLAFNYIHTDLVRFGWNIAQTITLPLDGKLQYTTAWQ